MPCKNTLIDILYCYLKRDRLQRLSVHSAGIILICRALGVQSKW